MVKKRSRRKKGRKRREHASAPTKTKQAREKPAKPPLFSKYRGWVVFGLSMLLAGVVFLRWRLSQRTEDEPRGNAGERIPYAGALRFTDVTEVSGISFRHYTGRTGRLLYPEIMGSGLALFDYDGDGDLDIYFLNGN
ncbi:hypothetical protein HQ563_17430, partial [bacterium]|nr:hypothetical protein [bacterium]